MESELVPSVNIVIDPHTSVDVEEPPLLEPIKPTRQKASREPDNTPIKTEPDANLVNACCYAAPATQMQCDPLELFQALGAAFTVGALTGALLYHAFSRQQLE